MDVRRVQVLAGLAAVLAVVFLVMGGIRVLSDPPPRSSGDRAVVTRAAAGNDPQSVATQVTLAFLDVDYRDMRPRVQKVLDLATGAFADEYRSAEANLTAASQEGRVVSTGTVRYAGLSEVTATAARVLVAADSTVSNTAIEAARAGGQPVDDKRSYRFQLDLTVVDGQWLVNELQFVP